MKTLSALILGAVVSLSLAGGEAVAQFGRGDTRGRTDSVCAYKDINYQGVEQCFNAGDEVANLGLANKSYSSFRVYGRASVTVYENPAFGGRTAQFDADVPDLGRRIMAGTTSWSDRIQSIRVGSDSRNSGRVYDNRDDRDNSGVFNRQPEPREGVCVYDRTNYQGRSECWTQGQNVADLARQGSWSDRISSIRTFGRTVVVLYRDIQFRGDRVIVDSSIPDLAALRGRDRGFQNWNDQISSLQVEPQSGRAGTYGRSPEPRDGICVYDRPNFQGRAECWTQGQNVSDLARQGGWSDKISSIRLFGRTSAILYRDIQFRGDRLSVDNDIADLAVLRGRGRSLANWNDQISSFQVNASNGNGRGNSQSRR